MRMTEAELETLKRRGLKVHDTPQRPAAKKQRAEPLPKRPSEFGSYAEEVYYQTEVWPRLATGELAKAELHRSFEILPAIEVDGVKHRAKVYTPDFVLTWANERVTVVEIKGKVIKRLQRDYQLRRHLFALRYQIPNGWTFEEVPAEGLTGG